MKFNADKFRLWFFLIIILIFFLAICLVGCTPRSHYRCKNLSTHEIEMIWLTKGYMPGDTVVLQLQKYVILNHNNPF